MPFGSNVHVWQRTQRTLGASMARSHESRGPCGELHRRDMTLGMLYACCRQKLGKPAQSEVVKGH